MKLANVNYEAPRPASAVAVEAVEARWREEERKRRSIKRANASKGCLSWLFLLLVFPGIAWYFAGEKVLPPEWTFSQIHERLLQFLNPEKSRKELEKVSKVDAADAATAGKRTAMRSAIKILDGLCWAEPPVQAKLGYVEKLRASTGRDFFEMVITADRNYQEACDKKAKMDAKNSKLGMQRGAEGVARSRQYLDQYSSKDFARQEMHIDKTLTACAQARLKCVKRTYEAVRSEAGKWTGPESRADAVKMLAQLETLYDKLLAKVKEDHPAAVSSNQPVRLGGR